MLQGLRFLTVYGALVLPVLCVGCHQPGGVEQISETHTLVTPKAAPPANATSTERFSIAGSASPPAATTAGVPLSWKTPAGWEELPSKQFRDINLRPAGDPKAECYVSAMGTGGGLTENVNRWRKQMGLEPIDDAAVAALPRKHLLGSEAVFVNLDGNFRGMGGEQDNPGFKLVGLIMIQDGRSVFAKMTGPKALIEQELSKFEEFTSSIQLGQGHPHAQIAASAAPVAPETGLPAGHPPVTQSMQGSGESAPGLTWKVPEGWAQAGPKPMRVVTLTPQGESDSECYVSKLINQGGGVDANINRWAGQMGIDPLSPDALAALPKIKVLGSDAPLVELKGTYEDMSGEKHPEFMMLGTIALLGDDAYFTKMVGPASEVESQKANFVAFCESLAL